MKRERQFLSQLGASFRERKAYFFKIPDMPHFAGAQFRFDIQKPFDAFACWAGIPIAIEAKVIEDFRKFGIKSLRPNQIAGLDAWSRSGGRAFVFLNVWRQARSHDRKGRPLAQSRVNRLYVFDWETLKAKESFSKPELFSLIHIPQYSYLDPEGKRKYRYNLDEFLVELALKS